MTHAQVNMRKLSKAMVFFFFFYISSYDVETPMHYFAWRNA